MESTSISQRTILVCPCTSVAFPRILPVPGDRLLLPYTISVVYVGLQSYNCMRVDFLPSLLAMLPLLTRSEVILDMTNLYGDPISSTSGALQSEAPSQVQCWTLECLVTVPSNGRVGSIPLRGHKLVRTNPYGRRVIQYHVVLWHAFFLLI